VKGYWLLRFLCYWKLLRLPEGPFYTTISNAVSNQPSPLRAGHHERGVELVSLFWVRSSIVTMGVSSVRCCVISYSLVILYHNWSGKSTVYVSFFILFIAFYLSLMIDLVNSYWPTPYYITLFLFVKRGDKRGSRGGAYGVGCTELTMYLFHSLSFIDSKRC
jgi:hypothetical protein